MHICISPPPSPRLFVDLLSDLDTAVGLCKPSSAGDALADVIMFRVSFFVLDLLSDLDIAGCKPYNA